MRKRKTVAWLLKSKSVDDILTQYPFPHRFLVAYAVACVDTVVERLKDERSLLALDVARRFSKGEKFTQKYLQKIYTDTSSTTPASAYATYATTCASTAAAHAAHAAAYASAATYSAVAAATCASKVSAQNLHTLLIDMIDKEFGKVEKMLMFDLEE